MPISRDFWAPPTPPARWQCRRPPTADEKPDGRVGGALRADGGKELGTGLDPAVGLHAGGGGDALGHALGGVDVVQCHVQAGHAPAGRAGFARCAEPGGWCAGWRLVPEVEDAQHVQHHGAAGSGGEAQLVAQVQAQVAGQVDADQDVGRADIAPPAHQLARQRRRCGSGPAGPCRGWRLPGWRSAHRQRRARHHRRDHAHAGHCADLPGHRLPLVDGLEPLQRRLHRGELQAGSAPLAAGASLPPAAAAGCGPAVSTRHDEVGLHARSAMPT